MTGHGRRQLLALSESLSERDLAILAAVDRFRLLQAAQLQRLFFHDSRSDAGGARVCRRALARLVDERLLHRLARRVGGVRAGSAGHIYATTAAAKRLLAYRDGRGIVSDRGGFEPSAAFVAHTLAIAELYVALVEAGRGDALELCSFETEPGCWRAYSGGWGRNAVLKPDAYVELAAGEYEHANFVEVDLGTAGRQALEHKLHAYLAYYRSGHEQAAHGWFPRVVWLTSSEARAAYISDLNTRMPGAAADLCSVGPAHEAVDLLLGTGATR